MAQKSTNKKAPAPLTFMSKMMNNQNKMGKPMNDSGYDPKPKKRRGRKTQGALQGTF